MAKPVGYKLRAFGYEVRASQDQSGYWDGSYRVGGTGAFTLVISHADLNETKIGICHYVQALAGQVDENGTNPCAKAVDDWKPI